MRKNRLLFISTLFFVFILFLQSADSAEIEGVVLSEHGPLTDVRVAAYASLQDIKTGVPLHTSIPGQKQGHYKLQLPGGSFYLIASGTHNGNEYFAFHGANPMKLEGERLWIPFAATLKQPEIVKAAESTEISGYVTFKGKLVADAQVSLYSLNDKLFKGMGLITNTTGADGFFSFSPEAGEYMVVARKKSSSKGAGSLKKGDLFCYYPGNPIAAQISTMTNIEVSCYPKDDINSFLNNKTTVKKHDEHLARYREKYGAKDTASAALSGRVTDVEGNPMPGISVEVYKSDPLQLFQMHYLRLKSEAAAKTDSNGFYSIEIKKKGSYYLIARELAGEAPVKGEYYGLYEGNVDHKVAVSDRDISGADIIISRVMAEKVHKVVKKISKNNKKKRIARLTDTIISEDTVWEGEVVIEGRILVGKRATLTIRPGTIIRFKKIDKDNDGIGDGEIRVLGKLIAKGTYQNRIRFTSAEKKPDKNDWSFVLFFVSGEKNIAEYCIFEYAFTGIQTHFSKTLISDSIFRNNQEGIRFGRAELALEHNHISGNTYGIRYHRMEGPIVIKSNIITRNDVGVFVVPSNQNIVNFSPTQYKADLRYMMMPTLTHNNIYDNNRYNYKLGERQGYDVDLKENWWGANKVETIQELIYDGSKDNLLGRALIKPYLAAALKGAGPRKKRRGI